MKEETTELSTIFLRKGLPGLCHVHNESRKKPNVDKAKKI